MKTASIFAITFAGAVLAGTLPSVADCMCAAHGTRYEHGAVVCLTVSGRSWLARCGKVLNNSSWEKIGDGCPQSRANIPLTPKAQEPAARPG